MIRIIVLIFFCLSSLAAADDNSDQIDFSAFPDPAEVLQRLDSSKVLYIVHVTTDSALIDSIAHPDTRVSNMYYLRTDDSGVTTALEFQLSDSAGVLFAIAEGAYQAEDYPTAIEAYRELLEAQPDFFKALTYIGDCFFSMADYDSAALYLQQAIDSNFVDYQAHWFLADALWHLGDSARTVEEITTAHLLNVNHPELKAAMIRYREKVGRPWYAWELPPVARVSGSIEDSVVILSTVDWTIYGLVKALWEFEPGYARERLGKEPPEGGLGTQECLDAIRAWMIFETARDLDSLPDTLADCVWMLWNVEKAGYMNACVWYSIIAPRYPGAMGLVDRRIFDRVYDYVDQFHTVPDTTGSSSE